MSGRSTLSITTETIAHLEEQVLARVDAEDCPGIFATLFQREHVFFEKSAGVRRMGFDIPDSDTTFRIASCTKSFTIVALLNLRDKGKLGLDQLITDFVPEYRLSDISTTKTIPTLRQLASMSSGLPTVDPWADRQESISGLELRRIVSRGVNATSAAGELFQYSNLGFALLGQAIESASGIDFREFVTVEILKPLGMNESGFDSEDFPENHLATGYRKVNGSWLALPFSASGAFSCIGGLFSSGKDLRIWSNWLHSAFDEKVEESGPLLAASRREMQFITTVVPFSTQLGALPKKAGRISGYGLGLFVEYDQRFGQFVSHSGGYPGFSSHMRWHVLTGLSVVVLENATYSGAWVTATGLLDTALEALNFELPAPSRWLATEDLATRADSLIREWSDTLAAEICAENVDMDVPFNEREESIRRLILEVGGLKESANLEALVSDSPLHFSWKIPGNKGDLQCGLLLTPNTPIRIQTLSVKRT